MGKITSTSDLNLGTEIVYDTSTLTIELVLTGNMTVDGVTLRCIYSFTKEQWKLSSDLIKYPFPLEPLDGPSGYQYNMVNGWNWKNTATTDLVKDGGWAIKDANSNSLEEWMNITSLGNFNDPANDKAYYLQSSGGNTVDISQPGEVNQAIKIYGDSTHGDFDYRDYFEIFLEVYGTSRSIYNLLTEQNLSTLTYTRYTLPLSNKADSYIVADETTAAGYSSTISVSYMYKEITIDGTATIQNIYDYCQYTSVQYANIRSPIPLTTTDGVHFVLATGWKLLLKNQITDGGNISGIVRMLQVFDMSDLNITGELQFPVAGTYNITDCNIDEVVNTSGGNVTINVFGTTNITTNTGPNISIVHSVALTISGIQPGSDVVIKEAGTNNVLVSVDSIQSTSYQYNYSVLRNVDIGIIKPGYVVMYIFNYALSSLDATLPIKQRVDRAYQS